MWGPAERALSLLLQPVVVTHLCGVMASSRAESHVLYASYGHSNHGNHHNYPDGAPKGTWDYPGPKPQGVPELSIRVRWQQWAHLWEVCPGGTVQHGGRASGGCGQAEWGALESQRRRLTGGIIPETDASASHNKWNEGYLTVLPAGRRGSKRQWGMEASCSSGQQVNHLPVYPLPSYLAFPGALTQQVWDSGTWWTGKRWCRWRSVQVGRGVA